MSTLESLPKPAAVGGRLSSPIFTDDHHQLRETLQRFVREEIVPYSDEWEETKYPNSILARMGELGFLGLDKPVEYGGQGGTLAANIVLFEEIPWGWSGGLVMGVSVQADMALPPILAFGTDEQKQEWAIPAIKGEKILALAMTEPDAGSDLANLRTRAQRDGDDWIINGAKTYITNGNRADVTVLLVRTDVDAGHDGFTTFLVPMDTSGVDRGKSLAKLGMHASDTAEMVFEDVRLPSSAVLGEVGRGFKQIMWELQGERLAAAASVLGMAECGLHATVRFARDREAFGRRLVDLQALNHRLAECTMKLSVARDTLHETVRKQLDGEYPVREISIAKLFVARVANEVLDECVQVLGGAGYVSEFKVERLWRDARLYRIGAGTDEIMLELIGRTLKASS